MQKVPETINRRSVDPIATRIAFAPILAVQTRRHFSASTCSDWIRRIPGSCVTGRPLQSPPTPFQPVRSARHSAVRRCVERMQCSTAVWVTSCQRIGLEDRRRQRPAHVVFGDNPRRTRSSSRRFPAAADRFIAVPASAGGKQQTPTIEGATDAPKTPSFIGRADAACQLRRGWGQACGDQGGGSLVAGEPGIGRPP